MPRQITCDDGVVVTGENDEELLAAARKHIQEAHADMENPPSDEELLAQAVDV
jgi:hypothetical protein